MRPTDKPKTEIPAALRSQDSAFLEKNTRRRKQLSRWFYVVCIMVALISVAILALLIASIVYQGQSRLSTDLLTRSHSELDIERSGMLPSILGSLAVCMVCAAAALPLGIGTAVFLEEFQPTSRFLRWWHGFIQINISNLAGVPSIVYGLLGLTVFVYMFNVFGKITVNEYSGWELMGATHSYQVLTLDPKIAVKIPTDSADVQRIRMTGPGYVLGPNNEWMQIEIWDPKSGDPRPRDPSKRRRTVKLGQAGSLQTEKAWYYFRLPFDKSFLAAGLTLALVILPIIIIASQEALRAVSPSLREASLGLGATRWQTVKNICLPAAIPGIMTGAILAMGRAIGEAAPILVVLGSLVAKSTGPKHLMDNAVTMPVLIYEWAGRPEPEFQELAAAAIIVLLVILLAFNSIAIYLRHRVQSDSNV
ncbi:Phosphate transport system permease protein PstA [Stieleria bergensis]|uniref:Phosphate transport system permease protein PstA n=2 Tax=Stieleria bergensis TaxID=2528025 RepID=A0A517SW19_9BACT|nr:Phosphate transport system permease protein PstA [Planctomycetes bacterium SV_7m_r]